MEGTPLALLVLVLVLVLVLPLTPLLPLAPAEPLLPIDVAGVADDLLSLENMLTCLVGRFRTTGAPAHRNLGPILPGIGLRHS